MVNELAGVTNPFPHRCLALPRANGQRWSQGPAQAQPDFRAWPGFAAVSLQPQRSDKAWQNTLWL